MNDNANYQPSLDEQELIDVDVLSIDQKITFSSDSNFEFYGTNEQRVSMFAAWAKYFAETRNPKNTVLNTFFKAKYAPLNAVLDVVRKPLSSNGLSIIQAPLIHNGDPAVKTLVTHSDGGILSLPIMSAKATKNDVQGIVASISYIRRVVVNSLVSVSGDGEDDDGNLAANQSAKAPPQDNELKAAKEEILKVAEMKISSGIDKDTVYDIFAKNNGGKKNPNAIKDTAIANKVIEELNKLGVKKDGE